MSDERPIPEALVRYFEQRAAQRRAEVSALFERLTERERRLVKEAAVMGWVQGMRHSDLAYPGGRYALAVVLDGCLAHEDLYPEPEDELEESDE